MSSIVYFLLFLWSIVQSGVFWIFLFTQIINTDPNNLSVSIPVFILINLFIGFITIFFTGQIHRSEKKRFLFKTIINALTAPLRLPLHIIVTFLMAADIVDYVDWGCYDEDNIVSIIVYSATLIDFEPSWGDFPSRVSEHSSTNAVVTKVRKDIAKKDNHAMKPYVETSGNGRTNGTMDVLNQARVVAKYCNSYVSNFGNRVDITFSPRMSGTVVYFAINLRHTSRNAFKSIEDKEQFERSLDYNIDRLKNEVFELMNKWSSVNYFDNDYSVKFEKGNIDL